MFIFWVATIAILEISENLKATEIIYDSTKTRPVRRRVITQDRGNSTARGVFGGAATGSLIGGLAGGGRGAGIGLGVGALTGGLIGSRRPRYREVVYEYDEPEKMYEEDVEVEE